MAHRTTTVAFLALWIAVTIGSAGAEPLHLPLTRRSRSQPVDLNEQANRLLTKYGFPTRTVTSNASSVRLGRRASSSGIAVTNHNTDNDYFASLDIGSPLQHWNSSTVFNSFSSNFCTRLLTRSFSFYDDRPQTLNVILDTGSADLWLAGTSCTDGCDPSTHLYQSSKSSSFQNSTSGTGVIKVNYGSGSVTGSISQETVTMGGFTRNNQVFLNVNRITGNITDADISGLMGLAFIGLADTNATPFWQALVQNNQLSSPEMSFYLARSSDPNTVDVSGGQFTLGGTDTSLFTGDLEFLNVQPVSGNQFLFWSLPVTNVTVGGKSVTFPSTLGNGALDTGTTLITGSSENIQAFWAAVPNSGLSRSAQGFFNYPCTTKLDIAFSFGGKSWPISEEDMNLGQDPDEQSKCVGAIFDGGITDGAGVSWIIGDTFLKNVYSVFRASDPPAVGLAQLSSKAGGSGAGSTSGGLRSSTVSIAALSTSMLVVLARLYL